MNKEVQQARRTLQAQCNSLCDQIRELRQLGRVLDKAADVIGRYDTLRPVEADVRGVRGRVNQTALELEGMMKTIEEELLLSHLPADI